MWQNKEKPDVEKKKKEKKIIIWTYFCTVLSTD